AFLQYLERHLQFILFPFAFSFATVPPGSPTEPGQNITLPCRVSENRPVIVVEWSRTGLGSDYVLFFRDHQIDPELQHPSFKDRVDLQDRQMKDGDVSLVLKNVTTEDTGTYECRVAQKEDRQRKLLSTINLQVSPPGELCQSVWNQGGSVGLTVGLPVSAVLLVLLVLLVGFMIYKNRGHLRQKLLSQNPNQPASEPAAEPLQN
uniref:Ig-like domain-containing protein n=1 Tax=Kryptolebias marmoratus TaxID=37003 RepID=A0A3Q3A7H0_KRYMA